MFTCWLIESQKISYTNIIINYIIVIIIETHFNASCHNCISITFGKKRTLINYKVHFVTFQIVVIKICDSELNPSGITGLES